MRLRVPALIVTVPGRTVTAARREIRRARAAGASFAEVRFDRWSSAERARASRLFPTALPLIATLRSRAEGGEGPNARRLRRRWLERTGALPFDYIDLEYARDLEPDGRPPMTVHHRALVSAHFRPRTPIGRVRAVLDDRRLRSVLVKAVVPASVGRCLRTIVPVVEGRRRGGPFIVHTTGASGPLLRAWGPQLGLAGVYASLPPAGGPAVELAQLPADRLRRFWSTGGRARQFAVVGRPIGHSLSPALHQRWIDAAHRPGLYVALEIGESSDLRIACERLPAWGYGGLNVTHPLKRPALRLADAVTPAAAACRGANTLSFRGGRIRADNTDLGAIRRRLDELVHTGSWDGRSIAVLGAGGAARATLEAVRSSRTTALVVARNRARAGAVARAHGAEVAENAAGVRPLVVNATTVGRRDGGPLGARMAEWVDRAAYLLDWVYRPDDPLLAHRAHRRRIPYEDGRRLLAYGAAASFGAWWGTSPSTLAIESAIREVM